jgi:predicted transcriptional regulator
VIGMPHSTIMDRDAVIASLSRLPKRVSANTLFYRLHLLTSLQAGLDDVAAGRTVSQAEVEKRFKLKRRQASRQTKKSSTRSSIRQKKS